MTKLLLKLVVSTLGCLFTTIASASWPQLYPGSYGEQIQADFQGNVYVAGSKGSAGLILLKYSPNGTLMWGQTYQPPGSNIGTTQPLDLVVGESGDIYVCADSSANAKDFGLTLRYDADGNLRWAKKLVGGPGRRVGFRAMDSMPGGGVVEIGSIRGDDNFSDLIVVRYGASGELMYQVNYGSSTIGTPAAASDVAVDSVGNLYVTGSLLIPDFTGHGQALLTQKYTAMGELAWAQVIDATGGGQTGGHRIALDSQENVMVLGYTTNAGGSFRGLAVKYANDGSEEWRTQLMRSGSSTVLLDMKVDSSDNVVLCGYTGTNSQDSAAYVAKLNAAGTKLWSTSYSGGDGQVVLLGTGGTINVAGVFIDPGTEIVSYLLLRYTADGRRTAAKTRQLDAGSDSTCMDAAIDVSRNRVYLTGAGYDSGPTIQTYTVRF